MSTNPPTSKRTVLLVVAAVGAVVLASASAAAVASAVAISVSSPSSAISPVCGSSMDSMGTGGTACAPAGASSSTPSPSSLPPVNTAGFPSGGRNPGIFTDTCMHTKALPNDPIMMPGMTGMSMQHDFFGNPAVSASSVSKDLVGGSTSCSTTADASAYWTPVVFQDGKALAPRSTLIYWRSPAASASSVHTMPAGMTMIAGNEAATEPQSVRVIDWTCTPSASDPNPAREDAPHNCGTGQFLRVVITFPNCWDGHSLGGKGQTNVVYQDASRACPSSHPVQIPQIVMHVAYPTSSAANLTLSTGPTQVGPTVTGHADFMMGWTQIHMDADVAACIDTQTRCGRTTGPDATPQGGRQLR